MHKGYLYKKNHNNNGWNLRWFVLREEHLSYYKNEDEYVSKDVIPIEQLFAANEVSIARRKNVFCLNTARRGYFLQAISKEEMQKWLVTFKKKIRSWKNDQEIPRREEWVSLINSRKTPECLKAHLGNPDFICSTHPRIKCGELFFREKNAIGVRWVQRKVFLFKEFLMFLVDEPQQDYLLLTTLFGAKRIPPEGEHLFCFLVITESELKVFSAETEIETEDWIVQLNTICKGNPFEHV